MENTGIKKGSFLTTKEGSVVNIAMMIISIDKGLLSVRPRNSVIWRLDMTSTDDEKMLRMLQGILLLVMGTFFAHYIRTQSIISEDVYCHTITLYLIMIVSLLFMFRHYYIRSSRQNRRNPDDNSQPKDLTIQYHDNRRYDNRKYSSYENRSYHNQDQEKEDLPPNYHINIKDSVVYRSFDNMFRRKDNKKNR